MQRKNSHQEPKLLYTTNFALIPIYHDLLRTIKVIVTYQKATNHKNNIQRKGSLVRNMFKIRKSWSNDRSTRQKH